MFIPESRVPAYAWACNIHFRRRFINFLAQNTSTAKEIKGILEVNLYFKPDFLHYEQILHFCAYFVVGGKHW